MSFRKCVSVCTTTTCQYDNSPIHIQQQFPNRGTVIVIYLFSFNFFPGLLNLRFPFDTFASVTFRFTCNARRFDAKAFRGECPNNIYVKSKT